MKNVSDYEYNDLHEFERFFSSATRFSVIIFVDMEAEKAVLTSLEQDRILNS